MNNIYPKYFLVGSSQNSNLIFPSIVFSEKDYKDFQNNLKEGFLIKSIHQELYEELSEKFHKFSGKKLKKLCERMQGILFENNHSEEIWKKLSNYEF